MDKMHPVIEVKENILDGKRHYELILSLENFNHLCTGCPDFDRLVGYTKKGHYFCIFPNSTGTMQNSFRAMPDGEGYYIYVGAPVPEIPQTNDNEEWKRFDQEGCDNLERVINTSGKIPIELETSLGAVNLGYVIMKVKKETVQ